jgi:hypothetical protein
MMLAPYPMLANKVKVLRALMPCRSMLLEAGSRAAAFGHCADIPSRFSEAIARSQNPFPQWFGSHFNTQFQAIDHSLVSTFFGGRSRAIFQFDCRTRFFSASAFIVSQQRQPLS